MSILLISRPVVSEDESLVSAWLEQDEVHRANGIKWADVVAPGTVAEVVSDEDGVILAVVRYHAALRCAFQFSPATYRIAKHGKELREMLEQKARNIGAKEVIIVPGGDAVRFADKLGFTDFTGSKIVGV
jgi:hypothetical protein